MSAFVLICLNPDSVALFQTEWLIQTQRTSYQTQVSYLGFWSCIELKGFFLFVLGQFTHKQNAAEANEQDSVGLEHYRKSKIIQSDKNVLNVTLDLVYFGGKANNGSKNDA